MKKRKKRGLKNVLAGLSQRLHPMESCVLRRDDYFIWADFWHIRRTMTTVVAIYMNLIMTPAVH